MIRDVELSRLLRISIALVLVDRRLLRPVLGVWAALVLSAIRYPRERVRIVELGP